MIAENFFAKTNGTNVVLTSIKRLEVVEKQLMSGLNHYIITSGFGSDCVLACRSVSV